MKEYFFLRRPVLALVLAIIILAVGGLCLQSLPVAQYPNLVSPTVSVTALYPGASPEVMADLVAAPLERALKGMADLEYVQSTCAASGMMNLTATFALGVDAEQASSRVNSQVQSVMAQLPDEVRRQGLSVISGSGSFLQIITLSSPDGRFDSLYLNNYATLSIIDALRRIPGVAAATSLIPEDYAMRVWLDPGKLAAMRLTPEDIAAAIREQNAQYAAGALGLEPAPENAGMTWLISTEGRMSTEEEFGNIIVRMGANKDLLRLRDVAKVTFGAADYSVRSRLDDKPVAGISIMLAPGANALATAKAIRQTMKGLSANFPPGVAYAIPYDVTTFVELSIDEVIKTLFEAMVLVTLVIFLFLQNVRATLIPLVAVPIAIIGTFAGMWLLGFSINTLTLFGMVLAIGIVVDDAIVILENGERIMQEGGLTARQATSQAMEEVFGPVIAIVLVLCAVFVPVSFMGGLTGEMFRQFGITIALSVILSGVVALTLTPVMCSRLLKPRPGPGPLFFRGFDALFGLLTRSYLALVRGLINHPLIGGFLFVLMIGATALLLRAIPQGLVPEEDQGYVIAAAILPDGASMPRTFNTLEILSAQLRQDPSVETILSIAGQDLLGGAGAAGNMGAAFVMLKPWDQRQRPDQSSFAMVNKVFAQGNAISDGLVVAFNPPPIVGMSTVSGLDGYLQSNAGAPLEELAAMGAKLSKAAASRPELLGVRCGLSLGTPKVHVQLDVTKAKLLDVPIAEVYQTLTACLSGAYINDFALKGRVFRVIMQADARHRAVPDDIAAYFVRSRSGQMVPLANLIHYRPGSGASTLTRFNGLTAARVSGQAAPGHSNLEAMQALEEVVRQQLGPEYSLAWSGSSFQEKAGGGTNYTVLLLGIGLVLLILAGQYEHCLLPLVVVTAVPFAVFGALLTIFLAGFANDVYVQVSLVTLIALAAKNAILIVEFAWEEFSRGTNAVDAAMKAAAQRFRPIVMTSLAFILGCLPLALSTGAGAGSRHVLGSSIIGGMMAATLIAPIFVPWFFTLLIRRKTPPGGVNGPGTDQPVRLPPSGEAG